MRSMTMVTSALAVAAVAGSASAALYTFEAPVFTLEEVTPLVDRPGNVDDGLRTTFTAGGAAFFGVIDASTFGGDVPNGLISGQFLTQLEPGSLVLTFNAPVTAISLSFALNALAPGATLRLTDSFGNSGSIGAVDVGGGQGYFGGNVGFDFAVPVTSVTIEAFEPTGAPTQFAIDNLNLVPLPAPASAGLLAVAGLAAARRRR